MANKIADIRTVSPGEEESKFIFFEPNNPRLAVRAHEWVEEITISHAAPEQDHA
jgi:hypothetical protein